MLSLRAVLTAERKITQIPLLPVSEEHSLIVHGERVTFDGAGGRASPFPLHSEFGALAGVDSLDLAAGVAARRHGKNHLAAASAISIDGKGAGFNCRRGSFVLYGARHLVPADAHQGIGADWIGTGSDLRILLAPSPDHYHKQGQQAEQKGVPRGLSSFTIQLASFWFHGGQFSVLP
jgi:hypothetical protein